ncbi:hypothetical protein D3C76_1134590 [compost metagenome]
MVFDDWRRSGQYALQGDAVMLFKHRAQGFMAHHQRIERGLQGGTVHLALQAYGQGGVVGSALRVQLPEHPLAILGMRNLQRRRPVQDLDFSPGDLLQPLQRLGESGQVGSVEQHPQGHVQAQLLPDPRDHLGSQQRMPTQGEEVVVEADLGLLQHVGPDGRDLSL